MKRSRSVESIDRLQRGHFDQGREEEGRRRGNLEEGTLCQEDRLSALAHSPPPPQRTKCRASSSASSIFEPIDQGPAMARRLKLAPWDGRHCGGARDAARDARGAHAPYLFSALNQPRKGRSLEIEGQERHTPSGWRK